MNADASAGHLMLRPESHHYPFRLSCINVLNILFVFSWATLANKSQLQQLYGESLRAQVYA